MLNKILLKLYYSQYLTSIAQQFSISLIEYQCLFKMQLYIRVAYDYQEKLMTEIQVKIK